MFIGLDDGVRDSIDQLNTKTDRFFQLQTVKKDGSMRFISITEEELVIKKFLKHSGLWTDARSEHSPVRIHAPPIQTPIVYAACRKRQPSVGE